MLAEIFATADDANYSPEILMKRVVDTAPELIELNHLPEFNAINFAFGKIRSQNLRKTRGGQ